MNELKEKNGIAKVTKKSDEMQKSLSNVDLEKDLNSINIDSVIKKTAVSRSIWKPETLLTFGSTEKSARRKLRALQLTLSKSVIRALKLNEKENAAIAINELQKFYSENLVSFENYSNVSENVNPDKFKIIHTAYSFMNAQKK
jgi:hypothetical protein